MMTDASKFLFTATNGHLHFKSVIIALPKSWPLKKGMREVGEDLSSSGKILIDDIDSELEPFTYQPGACGEPGEYIHLSAGFVMHLLNDTTQAFGNPGRTMFFYFVWSKPGEVDSSVDRLTVMSFAHSELLRRPSWHLNMDAEIEFTGGHAVRIFLRTPC